MKVKKAIIPAAGLGTRVLPASKAVPKEMLNIVDKPAIQYLVEEAVAAGIEDILIITNRGKGVIEDHFDHSFELEANLAGKKNKEKIYEEVKAVANLANIYFIRQKETKGLGHAILCGKSFVGDEPFAVLYGDDVTVSDDPVTAQLCRAYEKYGKGVEGFRKFVLETVQLAGSNPCPPIVLGIGVGGSFDKVAYLAKKALLRPLDVPNPDPYYAGLERELLTAINELGIGPQGFGGQTTCLGLAIEQMPTHVAGLPVAVNVSCHVTRRASARL